MSGNDPCRTQLIAMHGWGGDSRSWDPWAAPVAERGWRFERGERGYGQLPPHLPDWDPTSQRRIVLAHSLGPHLLPAPLWRQATAAVLLSSFSVFVPPGRSGRAVSAGLRGMAAQLEAGEAATQAMLRQFRHKVADPLPESRLPAGPLAQGIPPEGRRRLQEDLALLASCAGLPPGFPIGIPVLLVEAQDDQIVTPESRALLRQALPQATVWSLEPAGHALLATDGLPSAVLEWMADGPH